MEQVFPIAFLPENHALAVAIMSYNGQMNFGLLADYDALPDLDRLAERIHASLTELVDLARAAGGGDDSAGSNGAGQRSRATTRA
jgi:hypothetical protein